LEYQPLYLFQNLAGDTGIGIEGKIIVIGIRVLRFMKKMMKTHGLTPFFKLIAIFKKWYVHKDKYGLMKHKAEYIKLRQHASQELKLGHVNVALDMFHQILKLNDRDAIAWSGAAECYEALSDFELAIQGYKNACAIATTDFQPLHRLGRLFIKLSKPSLAIPVLTNALQLNDVVDAVWCDLGQAQMVVNDYVSAKNSFNSSVAINSKNVSALTSLGECYRELGEPQKARLQFEIALSTQPDFWPAINALAISLSDLDKAKEALYILDSFIDVNPGHVQAHQNKALILLRNSQIKQGFQEYEWRLHPSSFSVPTRPFPFKRWDGNNIKSNKTLIWLEQGLGDEILSLSTWRSHLGKTTSNQFYIECDQRLQNLIQRSFPQVKVYPRTNPPSNDLRKMDFVCPSWSGVHIANIDIEHRENSQFLRSCPKKTASLRQKYKKLARGRTIVGLSWSSGGQKRVHKNPQLQCWAPLLKRENCYFVSTQYSGSESDLIALNKISGAEIYQDKSIDLTNDIDDAASQLAALDIAVTVSNTTAHLAGALGVPVATLIPSGHGGFWYWFRKRSDSPWYPSMHIFRQTKGGKWTPAIANISNWINEMSSAPSYLL